MQGPRRLRRAVLLLLFALALGACSPPFPGRVVQDLAFNPDGQLIEIDANDGPMFPGEPTVLTGRGRISEVCLDDGACVRLVGERQIEESTDGWDTSTVVWNVSPSDTWWRHEYDDGHNPMVIGVYDIVVLPDQTVAVAAGQLPLLRRSTEGEWTPSIASLRTLPSFALTFAIAAAAVVGVIGLAMGAPHRGTGAARVALGFLAVPFLFGAQRLLLGDSLLTVFGVMLLPLVLSSAGFVVGSVLRARANDGFLSAHAPRITGSGIVALASWIGTYALWSAGRLGWNPLLGFWAVSFIVAAVGACHQSKAQRASQRALVPDPPVSLVRTGGLSVLLAYTGAMAAIILSNVGLPGGTALRLLQQSLTSLVVIAGVVWFTARGTLHARKPLPAGR